MSLFCSVQRVQELAQEATLNISLDETISAMMMHIGDVVQSTGKTKLQLSLAHSNGPAM